MDSFYELDRDALAASIARAEHLLFRFVTVSPRLFVDFRSDGEVGPGVHVLRAARTLFERIATIREARPELPLPERLLVVEVPARVRGLKRIGAFPAIRDRLVEMDAFDQAMELHLAYEQLQAFEREEIRQAITGDGYRTLWTSTREP
jgi:hypothetical protein